MAQTKTKGIQLIDDLGRDITPEHARLGLGGDVFLTFDLEDLPPMHAEVEVTIRGHIVGPFQLKEVGDPPVWVVLVKLKGEEKRGGLKVIAPPPPPPGELPLDDGAGKRGVRR